MDPVTIEYLKEQLSEYRLRLERQKTEVQNLKCHVKNLTRKIDILQLVFKNSVDVIIVVDAGTGRIIKVSDAVEECLGYDRSELIGYDFTLMLPEETDEILESEKQKEKRILDGVFMGQEFKAADGSARYMDMTVNLVGGGSNTVIIVTLRDTSERKRFEQELRIRNTALESSLSATALVTPDWRISYVNDALLKTWGLSSSEILFGKPLHILLKKDKLLQKAITTLELQGQWTGELPCQKYDGTDFPALVLANTVKNDSGNIVCLVFSFIDITKRRALESDLKALSLTDSLTDLYNRRGFIALGEDVLRAARRSGKKVGMFFLDLDCLKLVNDRFGHDEGDKTLVALSTILKNTLRELDIAARIGGDEFAIFIIRDCDETEKVLKKRLEKSIKDFNSNSGFSYTLSVSIGYAESDPVDSSVIEKLLLSADRAMYREKQEKKEQYTDEDLVFREISVPQVEKAKHT